MKNQLLKVLIVLLSLLLIGCTSIKQQETTQSPTVENVFTQPTATTAETFTQDSQPPEDSQALGSVIIGAAGDSQKDEKGTFYTYNGGEMVLPFRVEGSGSIVCSGIGILLFVDGLPQPYKTEGTDYGFLHTFFPPDNEDYTVDLVFTPVTGKAGDDLEVYAVSVLAPNYSYTSKDSQAFPYTGGSPSAGFRLKYQQTPPEETFPKESLWLSNVEIRKESLSFSEIGDWSEQELQENLEYHFFANNILDTSAPYVYEVEGAQPIHLRYEVFGSPYVRYHLVFFVDNQPVASREGTPILVDVETGQKTVVEAQLDMTGFDTESVLYAVLVPQNYFSTPTRTFATVTPSSPIFLLEGASEDYNP